jgi:ribosome biogenesis GTPase
MIQGVIIKSTGSWYEVLTEEGRTFQCRIVGKLRLDDLKTTNPVSVGDQVRFQLENPTEGTIAEVLPRKNYVVRQSPRKKHNVHLIACNVDQALLITTIVEPKLKQGFIDRFLLMTEPYNIPVIIAFNKSDIYGEEDLAYFKYLKAVYENIGYIVLLSSANTKQGIDDIKTLIQDKITLISGQSGVGKTSLVNAIEPKLDLKTHEISDFSGKGQHTTTFAEMHRLSLGGFIIDTPGIKTLAFNHLEVQDVAHNFREFFILSKNCKFNDCTHRNEPKCAVKTALENQEISEWRYQNYLNIIEEIENQNYWEIHDDI